MENGLVKVVSPIDDTPAARAGLKPGDLITHLDGDPVQGMTLPEAVEKMRGPVSSEIKLTIRREGAVAWHGQASTASLRRKFDDLVGYLMRADIYPDGVVLATGTCLVPPAPFSLADGDVVTVAVAGVGTLTTVVVRGLDRMLEAFAGAQGP